MIDEKKIFWRNTAIVFAMMALLWTVHYIQYFNLADLDRFGNMPRVWHGLPGILFSPFIHGNTESVISMHLLSNSLPLMILLMLLLHAFPKHAFQVWLFIQLFTGATVWIFGTPGTVHVGISGMVYGLTGFFSASGMFRRDRTSVLIAVFVAILYGSSVVGFLPAKGVSWHSHLFGFITGILLAWFMRKVDLPLEEIAEEELPFFQRLERARSRQLITPPISSLDSDQS